MLTTLVVACSADATSEGDDDVGGRVTSNDQETKPGRMLVWPAAPSMIIERATEPNLVAGPGGERTLLYLADSKVWAWRSPPEGAPVELGPATGLEVEISSAASPNEDRIFVAWGSTAVLLSGGIPERPAFSLSREMLYAVGTTWVQYWPVVTAFHSGGFLAFMVPLDSLSSFPLPAPTDQQFLLRTTSPFHHFNEIHRVLDLGDRKWLLFDLFHSGNPADPEHKKHWLGWRLITSDASSTGPERYYQVPSRSGYMEIPYWMRWVQAQALPDGRYVLTFGASETSLVYDVYLALLDIAEDGTPSLASSPVNISQTTGETQNSDHPLLRPTGDGRYWLAWRETDMGPMVALLDEKLNPRRIVGPPGKLVNDMSSSLGAVVDAEGTLHLAVVMRGDEVGNEPQLHIYSVKLPANGAY